MIGVIVCPPVTEKPPSTPEPESEDDVVSTYFTIQLGCLFPCLWGF